MNTCQNVIGKKQNFVKFKGGYLSFLENLFCSKRGIDDTDNLFEVSVLPVRIRTKSVNSHGFLLQFI